MEILCTRRSRYNESEIQSVRSVYATKICMIGHWGFRILKLSNCSSVIGE